MPRLSIRIFRNVLVRLVNECLGVDTFLIVLFTTTFFFLTFVAVERDADFLIRLAADGDDFVFAAFDERLATAEVVFFLDFPAMSRIPFQRNDHRVFVVMC